MTTTGLTVHTLQGWLDESPFTTFLRLTCEVVDVEKQTIALRMPMRPELMRDGERIHGGPVASLVDIAGDFAVILAVGGGVPTINMRVDYLRPSTGSSLIARAAVRRAGRTLAVADIDVLDDRRRLTAIGRGTYATTPTTPVTPHASIQALTDTRSTGENHP